MGQAKPSQWLSAHYFYLLPAISSTAWFITLLTLLIYWFAQGRPRYPFQADPEVAFISDIAAHPKLKPLFIVGGSITALTYSGTIFAANWARHKTGIVRNARANRVLERFALSGGVIAAVACGLLTGFDTVRWHNLHRGLLMLMFLGIAISAICTAVVYREVAFGEGKGMGKLRNYCLANITVVIVEMIVTVAFVVCVWTYVPVVQGCLEWAMAFLGSVYIWTFIGVVTVPDENGTCDTERQPLLQGER